MKTTSVVYSAIKSLPKSYMISVDELVKITGLNYFQIETSARALAKENYVSLCAICNVGENPLLGVFKGNAKQKEYYFMHSSANKKYK